MKKFRWFVLFWIFLAAGRIFGQGTDAVRFVKDIYPGPQSSNPSGGAVLNGILFFAGTDASHGTELWRSDGSTAGTYMVKDIFPGTNSSGPSFITALNGLIYFNATDGVNGYELWQSDGTPEGTFLFWDLNSGAGSGNPSNITAFNGILYFQADLGTGKGAELYAANGNSEYLPADLNPGSGGSYPGNFCPVGSTLYFTAYDATHGTELWKLTSPFTSTLVKDINPGSGGSNPLYLTNVNGTLFFNATDGTNGYELWKSDGTNAGTQIVKDIWPGSNSSNPTNLANLNGTLLFNANDGTNGNELWKSDGTNAGTQILKDIWPGASSSNPNFMTLLNNVLLFSAWDGTNGTELWKTDGTNGGTQLVKDINPGSNHSNPTEITVADGKAYFRAQDGVHGNELWVSDGTSAGTSFVADINPGSANSSPGGFVVAHGQVFFNANEPVHGTELWKVFPSQSPGVIQSVSDIPNDQGGHVRLQWQASAWDSVLAGPVIVSYGVWRKVPPGMTPMGVRHQPPGMAVSDTILMNYDFIESVPAVQIPRYNVVVPTLADSTSGGSAMTTYLITTHTPDPYEYYVTAPDSGYSVDNLAPGMVTSVTAQVQTGPVVNVQWDKDVTDPDVGHYEVHRSTSDGFAPNPSTRIGSVSTNAYVDNSPVVGMVNYYRVVAVDVHGNSGAPSSEAPATVNGAVTYGVSDKWNLVSVPLTVPDYAKTTLYPTAISNAFAYQNGYVAEGTLANGSGYWLKFSGSQSIGVSGLVRTHDSVSVQAGWNLVGSLSAPIAVGSIGSIPGGMVASQFFGYHAGYFVADSIKPGQGYWVKVNQSGRLVLASSWSMEPSTLIRVLPNGEQPPAPPDGDMADGNIAAPQTYALEQNYPNPFNPSTVIRYQLPVTGYVRLSVYDILGREVVRLVDGVQDAGFKSVVFDAASAGNGLTSGVYLYRLSAGTYSESKKLLLLK